MIERYQSGVMQTIWGRQHRLELWLSYEAAAMAVHSEAASQLLAQVDVRLLGRLDELESLHGHEFEAFLRYCEEQLPIVQRSPDGPVVPPDALGFALSRLHMGLTSSDIQDTATLCQIRESCTWLETLLVDLEAELDNKGTMYCDWPRLARTHGQPAEESNWGAPFWHHMTEISRCLQRIRYVREACKVGKFSGVAGNFDTHQALILKRLDLNEIDCTQVVPRDLWAEYFVALAFVGSACERLALNVRLWSSRGEWWETSRHSKPVGSSAMPHKRNPIQSERICGLARQLRAYVVPAFESCALWEDRDLSHSSFERVALPDASHLAAYVLTVARLVVTELRPDEETINRAAFNAPQSSAQLATLQAGGMIRSKAWERARTTAWAVGPSARISEADQPRRTFAPVALASARVSVPQDVITALADAAIIVFDVDGTLAEVTPSRIAELREKYQCSPDELFMNERAIAEFMDPARLAMAPMLGRGAALLCCSDPERVVFWSSRTESLRAVTERWLKSHFASSFIPAFHAMRLRANEWTHLAPHELKGAWLDELANKALSSGAQRCDLIVIVVDDDPEVRAMARGRGFRSLCPQTFELLEAI
jgi:adenylosuccinate lyase